MTRAPKGVPLRLTTPCAHCPFRTDIRPYLSEGRARQIAKVTFDHGAPFNCHKTLDYQDGEPQVLGSSQNCAGAVILAEKIGKRGQIAQIAERLRLWSPDCLDMDAPVFDTVEAFIAAQKG